MPLRAEFPEEGELVVGTVTSIRNFGAFVTLDEYNNREAFIHLSEVATGWVKYIRDHIREGQKIVARVLRVDPVEEPDRPLPQADQRPPAPREDPELEERAAGDAAARPRRRGAEDRGRRDAQALRRDARSRSTAASSRRSRPPRRTRRSSRRSTGRPRGSARSSRSPQENLQPPHVDDHGDARGLRPRPRRARARPGGAAGRRGAWTRSPCRSSTSGAPDTG